LVARADASSLFEERFLGSHAELAHRELAGAERRSARRDRYQVIVHIDPEALRHGDGICHLDDGPALAPETVRRTLCDGAFVPVVAKDDVLDVGRKTRVIPTALRRALAVRDGGCRFPGCAAPVRAGMS
jgi:hypothetical protein